MSPDASNRVRTRHAELSLEEIAGSLPGTGEVMASVGRCFGNCWHAASGGNWELAHYFLRRVRTLLRGLALTRPKYKDQIESFDASGLEPVQLALVARDLRKVELAFARAVQMTDGYHVDTGFPYIRWRLPSRPADEGLDMTGSAAQPSLEPPARIQAVISEQLLKILACPKCHGKVVLTEDRSALDCHACKLRYQIVDGIPVMLVEEAQPL